MAIAVAAVILLGVGAGAWQQLAAFHPVATIALHGSSATANAEVGPAHGPNRPVRLIVQHLSPGHQNYFELWSLDEHPPMMLTTFMTDSSGSCTLMFSMPASMPWNRLAVTTLSDDSRYLLSSTG